MGRFYVASDDVYDLLHTLVDERFPNLRTANVKIFMDTKLQKDRLTGKIKFSYIKLTNEVEKLLTIDGHHLYGVDYFMFINDLVWELAGDKDKKRLISHELRHCFVDDKGNYRLVKHDIEDFYDEIELNKDDPMWGSALSIIVDAKYEQIKAEERAMKNAQKQGE